MQNTIDTIHSEDDYLAALNEVERLSHATEGTPEAARLQRLATMISAYDAALYCPQPCGPLDAIMSRIDQLGCGPSDLIDVFGSLEALADILEGRSDLTPTMVCALTERWAIPADLLSSAGRSVESSVRQRV